MLCFNGHDRQLEACQSELAKLRLDHAVLTERMCGLSNLLTRLDRQVQDLNEENRTLLDRVFFLANANPPEAKVEAVAPKPEASPEPARTSEASRRQWLNNAQKQSAELDQRFEQQVTLAVKEIEYAST